MRIRLLLFVAVLVLLPAPLIAQTISLPESAFEVEVIPIAPEPGEQVTLRAQSFSGNMANTRFVWIVNGETVVQGVQQNTITITAGEVGSVVTVVVRATEGGTLKGERTISLRPAAVDIVWEADSTTVPFSGTLPLVTGGSLVTLQAIPQLVRSGGVRVATDDLLYTWHVNGERAPRKQGQGENVLRINTPVFMNAFSVTVTVSTFDGSIQAEREVNIEPAQPEVIFYENAPLLGMRFDRAVTASYTLEGEEITFRAYPLHTKRSEGYDYQWTLNGEAVESEGADSRQLTLRKTGEGTGRFNVGFSFERVGELFGRGEGAFFLRF